MQVNVTRQQRQIEALTAGLQNGSDWSVISCRVEGLENIADNLSKAGWSLDWVSVVDPRNALISRMFNRARDPA